MSKNTTELKLLRIAEFRKEMSLHLGHIFHTREPCVLVRADRPICKIVPLTKKEEQEITDRIEAEGLDD